MSLVEYLFYLKSAYETGQGTFDRPSVSLAQFREYAAVYATASARDGNDYAVFPATGGYVLAVLDNALSNGAQTGTGSVNVFYVCDTYELAQQQLIQVMIYDNDLTGVYDSNNHD